ncbi:hypothetical protein GVAV_000903 [Gurleya vavrai]
MKRKHFVDNIITEKFEQNDSKKVRMSNIITNTTKENIKFDKTVVCTCGTIYNILFEIMEDVPSNSNPVDKFYTEFMKKKFFEINCPKSSTINEKNFIYTNNYNHQTEMARNSEELKLKNKIIEIDLGATSNMNQKDQVYNTKKFLESFLPIEYYMKEYKNHIQFTKEKFIDEYVIIFFDTNQEKVINLFKYLDLIFSKQTNTIKQIFYDKKEFFEKIEQKALKDHFIQIVNLPRSPSKLKKNYNLCEGITPENKNQNQRINYIKTNIDKKIYTNFSNKNIIYDESNQTYHYAKKYYSDFFVNKHSQDFLEDLINKNFCFATFLKKLNFKILHSDFEQVSKFTNLMFEENLIYFDHFMKIIVACNENFENKVKFDFVFDYK